MAAPTAFACAVEVVTRMAQASSSCSDWASISMAISEGSALSSAMTHDLRWTGLLVDGAEGRHQPLGERYEDVAGAGDLQDGRDMLGAVGQCGHGMGAADAEDPRRPAIRAAVTITDG